MFVSLYIDYLKKFLADFNETWQDDVQCVRFYSDEVKRLPFQKFFEYFEHFNFMKKLHSVQFFFQKIIVFAWILKIL